MTCVAAFLDDTGAGFVSDRRVIANCSVVSDTFCKVSTLAGGRLTVAFAGEVGPAQVWMRAAQRNKVKDLEGLLAEHCGGDFGFIVYDAIAHELYSGCGACSLIPITHYSILGSGEDFVRGYLHAGGLPTDRNGKLDQFARAISECSMYNLSVSRDVDSLFISRARPVPRARRKSRRRRA